MVCGDGAFTLKEFDGSRERGMMYRMVCGKPTILDAEGVMQFMSEKEQLHRLRQDVEQKMTKCVDRSYLKKRLVELICFGDDKLKPDVYPVLLLDKPNSSTIQNKVESLSFLKNFNWMAVFDFDNEGTIYKHLDEEESQNMRVITVEEFDKNCKNEHLLDELKSSMQQPWVRSNGYKEMESAESEDIGFWTRDRLPGFRDALQFLKEQIPDGRANIVFLMLSEESPIMREAACLCTTYFPDQFVILAEEENTVTGLKHELVRRKYADENVIEERCVVGIPWPHVQNIIGEITGSSVCLSSIRLPTSTGAECELTKKKQNRWTDLEILASNECDREQDVIMDTLAQEEKRRDVEEEFYKGHQVKWWNFWFQNQVMRRQKHADLKKKIDDALRGKNTEMEDHRIASVTLYHQPGSGGSTMARHILWEYRTRYRCAVVNSITEMTGSQILELRDYEDLNPGPVIILLDNPDDEKLANLTAWMEHKSRECAYEKQKQNKGRGIWYLFLLCRRISEPPKHPYGSHIMLKQELTTQEVSWLQDTHNRLEETHKENKGTDPKYLISFNILKSGFNRSQIESTVKEFVGEVKKRSERLLLKYVAFLSTYHIHHRYVPLAVFDNLMRDTIPRRVGGARRHLASNLWELHLSTSCEILMDRIESEDHWHVRSIGIVHHLLAEELLKVLIHEDNQTTGLVALDLMNNPFIFIGRSGPLNFLLRLLRDIFVMRERKPDGKHATEFSPLIQQIISSESQDKAQQLFIKAYKLTENAFVAQHVARFFISIHRWSEAEEYATEATKLMPDNSYLWDTYAQIYRRKLLVELETRRQEKEVLSTDHAIDVIDIAHRATHLFKKVQEVSERETQSPIVNSSGFFGAIRVFITLMNCLCFLDVFREANPVENRRKLRKILEGTHLPAELEKWKNVRRTNYIIVLQNLGRLAQESYIRLGDEHVQLRENHPNDQIQNQNIRSQDDLDFIKSDLEAYFGRARGEIPANIPEEVKCHLRRRSVYSLAGPGIREIFAQKPNVENLRIIQRFMLENVRSSSANIDDFRKLISVCLALIASGNHSEIEVSYGQLAEYSRHLYEKRETLEFILLEPYLYFTMFNWPRDNTNISAEPTAIKQALTQWRSAFGQKYPRQKEEGQGFGRLSGIHRKKETVMFFFAPRDELYSIVSYDHLRQPNLTAAQFWRDSQNLKKMQRFRGLLSQNGRDVTIALKSRGPTEYIKIPTSLPIRDTSLYNKHVYFVIGFSWSGPKAFDVDSEVPQDEIPKESDKAVAGGNGSQPNGWQVHRRKGKH